MSVSTMTVRFTHAHAIINVRASGFMTAKYLSIKERYRIKPMMEVIMAHQNNQSSGTDPTVSKSVTETPSKPYERVMALPGWLRIELNYLAFMPPDPVDKESFYRNIAVSGERILAKVKTKTTKEMLHRMVDDVYYNVHGKGTSNYVDKLHIRIEEL